MLTRLLINNVVLIEKAELDFSGGLTVFSGETGAGKSILMESLGFALGARADTGAIRKNADKLCVTATFEIKDKSSPFYQICKENELDIDDEIIIKRTLSTDAKSKILVNDQPVTLKLLKQLASQLAEINGQFDNQGLLDPLNHIDLLDAFGGYTKELENTQIAYKAYLAAVKKLNDVSAMYEKAVLEEETLKHYQSELENLAPKKGEEEALNQKRQEMMSSEKILENLNTAYQSLQGQGLASSIRHALSAIDKVNRMTNDKFQNIADALDTALIEVDEAASQIETASTQVSYNQNDINTLEERLFALKDLARKHRCSIDDLPDVLQEITEKLALIEKNGDDTEVLAKQAAQLKEDFKQKAQILHQCRLNAAQELSKKVQEELKFLKMEKAVFRVCVNTKDEQGWSSKGFDDVFFEVATNEGTPFGALNKIASGGELARFMLAIKVHLALSSHIETLVFDEVDAGLSGAAAEAVGNRLLKLSEHVQVLTITHSPQVASFSQTHFKVQKKTENAMTSTTITRLSDIQKKEEIARMLSGETITDEARAAADKLIVQTAWDF